MNGTSSATLIIFVLMIRYETTCLPDTYLISFKTENVALGQMATQSGTHLTFSRAGNAVDGDPNADIKQESCSLSGKLYIYIYIKK